MLVIIYVNITIVVLYPPIYGDYHYRTYAYARARTNN